MQFLILAGGLGTRLRPITLTRPKALVLANGAPFIDYQLRWLQQNGVKNVVLSIGYLGEPLREFVGTGARWKMNVEYVHDGESQIGTAGAIQKALDENLLDSDFALMYGDSFLPIRFADVFSLFQQRNSNVLMTVLKNNNRWDKSNTCFENGVVRLYDKGLKSSEARALPMDYIDYGVTLFRRSIVADFFPKTVPADLAPTLLNLTRKGLVDGYEVTERFYEVGSPDGLKDFESWLKSSECLLQ